MSDWWWTVNAASNAHTATFYIDASYISNDSLNIIQNNVTRALMFNPFTAEFVLALCWPCFVAEMSLLLCASELLSSVCIIPQSCLIFVAWTDINEQRHLHKIIDGTDQSPGLRSVPKFEMNLPLVFIWITLAVEARRSVSVESLN